MKINNFIILTLLLVLVSGCINNLPPEEIREPTEYEKPQEGDVIVIDKPVYRAELWKSRGYSIQSFVHKLTGNELHAPGSGFALDTMFHFPWKLLDPKVPDYVYQEYHTPEGDANVTVEGNKTIVSFVNRYQHSEKPWCLFRYKKTYVFDDSNVISSTIEAYNWTCAEDSSYISGYINTRNHEWKYYSCGLSDDPNPTPVEYSTADVGCNFLYGCPLGFYSDVESIAIITPQLGYSTYPTKICRDFRNTQPYSRQFDCVDRFREEGVNETVITSYLVLLGPQKDHSFVKEVWENLTQER